MFLAEGALLRRASDMAARFLLSREANPANTMKIVAKYAIDTRPRGGSIVFGQRYRYKVF